MRDSAVRSINVVPLDKTVEGILFRCINQDRISHFYTICNLKYSKEKTHIWIALADNAIAGYLMEFDRRILYMRGIAESAVPLLRRSILPEALFNIERHHLPAVKGLYRLKAPADQVTKGQFTTFLTMKANRQTFAPAVKHDVQELHSEDSQALANLLGIEPQAALGFFRGFAFGIFKDGRLISYAASPEILEDLAIVRGVFTATAERNKGCSTSVCSVLVERLLQEGKHVMLYVSKDNTAAIKVYEKVGFRETGHIQLGFSAKRIK